METTNENIAPPRGIAFNHVISKEGNQLKHVILGLLAAGGIAVYAVFGFEVLWRSAIVGLAVLAWIYAPVWFGVGLDWADRKIRGVRDEG